MARNQWLEVDKIGLSKILERRGKSFVVYELIQNAWDQNVTAVDVSFDLVEGKHAARLVVVDDDPKGFEDLTHAFTLFAESRKKGDPAKRGRFNIGEKLVLACCEEAEVVTTCGGVKFARNGERKLLRRKTDKGSAFSALVRMTKSQFADVCRSMDRLIPPRGIVTTFNGKSLKAEEPVASFEAPLPTEISDKEGNLKRTVRRTTVNVYRVKEGDTAHLYEMGIPVVETGDTYHVDIQQKVPLNMDRDNVNPAYLRAIRTLVLNNTYDLLQGKDVNATWVHEAASNRSCKDEAVTRLLDVRFGPKRVIYDPSDLEANNRAVSEGYTVIRGSQFSKDEWHNIRRTGTTLPAGQVTPSQPHTSAKATEVEPTAQMKRVIGFSETLAEKLMGVDLVVAIVKSEATVGADYRKTDTGGHLRYNVTRLRQSFFDDFPDNAEEVIDLLIHEFGHHYSGDHLSAEYHRALSNLGAKATMLAVSQPEVFRNT